MYNFIKNLIRMKILVINGPNLNLLGKRENDIYGSFTLHELEQTLLNTFPQVELSFFQSNIEGEIINCIQEFGGEAMVINAGGYTHTSVAIADALRAVAKPYVEVHISNIYAREHYRHVSMLAASAKGVIAGLGKNSYVLAVQHLIGS
jgi:3-dehydroquinate dehydratase-2